MVYEPLSKLPVSPLITPIIVPYIISYITLFKEFRLLLILGLYHSLEPTDPRIDDYWHPELGLRGLGV